MRFFIDAIKKYEIKFIWMKLISIPVYNNYPKSMQKPKNLISNDILLLLSFVGEENGFSDNKDEKSNLNFQEA